MTSLDWFWYSGTLTCPAMMIARSASSQWAQFFDVIAIRLPGAKLRAASAAAMRRASFNACDQVQVRSMRSTGWCR